MVHAHRRRCGGAKRVQHAADLSDGNAGGVEGRDPVVGRPGGEGLFEQRQQCVAVQHAGRVGGEPLVGRELGPRQSLAEPREEAVVRRRDGDPAVRRGERLIRDDARVGVAVARRLLAHDEGVLRHVDQSRERRVE